MNLDDLEFESALGVCHCMVTVRVRVRFRDKGRLVLPFGLRI